jgi:2,4-dienoyl-CoA reductase-like NADH-dependent reductase (Old Yellow Enzyme family)
MNTAPLFQPLQLHSGEVIPNRLAKAAMEENLCDADHAPGAALIRLYQTWADGGAGLIITGNVMVDRRALTGPGGVVLEDDRLLPRFAAWAASCQSKGAGAWMQINHPGRQVLAAMGQVAVAPSDVALDIPGLEKAFAPPRALTADEIGEVVGRFRRTALLAERAGFTGVQIHAAHGYLLNQFLSPHTNRRTDAWGGSLENRARLLLDVVRAVRTSVGPGFSVAVKLNSADFQRGGFDADDANQVVRWLGESGVDLVELTGGNYESPAMRGLVTNGWTLAREAYFVEFAKRVALVAEMPLMLTGGIRRLYVAEQVLRDGLSMVGMATSLALMPNLPQLWRSGRAATAPEVFVSWRRKALAAAAASAVVKTQLDRISRGLPPRTRQSPIRALLCTQIAGARKTRRYRAWMAQAGMATDGHNA